MFPGSGTLGEATGILVAMAHCRPPKAVFTPTPQNCFEAIQHVVYEYASLRVAYHFSMRGQAPWRTQCDDAFLLGYRKLRDFLLGDPATRYKDDVLAMDYLPAGSIRSWDLQTWESTWKKQMNRHLAHIAYARVLLPGPIPWDHTKYNRPLMLELVTAWEMFLSAVVDPGVLAEFRTRLAAESRLKAIPLGV